MDGQTGQFVSSAAIFCQGGEVIPQKMAADHQRCNDLRPPAQGKKRAILMSLPGKMAINCLTFYINSYIVHLMKELHFIDSARTDLAAFPDTARRQAGHELWRVQVGRMPTDWKTMPSVGAGAMEIRIQMEGAWRVIYVAKFNDAIHVLHAFQKKTQKTSQTDIMLAARRYRQIGG
ncbi:MAG: type II toxin-antitoxin system RelE/ParE family toxin [Magnetococcus sp. YQC-9]